MKVAVIFRIRGVKGPRISVKWGYSKSEQLKNAREERGDVERMLEALIKSWGKTLESFLRLNGDIVIYH